MVQTYPLELSDPAIQLKTCARIIADLPDAKPGRDLIFQYVPMIKA